MRRRASARFIWLAGAAAVLVAVGAIAFRGHATPPEQTDAAKLVLEARDAYGRGDYRRSREAAQSLLGLGAERPVALSYLGWSEYYLGNYGRAQHAFDEMLRLVPGLTEAQIGLGWSEFKLGRFAAAAQSFRLAFAVAKPEERVQIYDGLGWIAFFRGRYRDARFHFEAEPEARATATLPHDRELGLGWIALLHSDPAAARKHFAEGLRAQRANFRLHDGMARAALLSGDAVGSVQHALSGLRLAPGNRDLFYLLDAALVEAGGKIDALAVYEDLAKRYPYVVNFHNGRGHHARLAGKLRIAETAFSIALQIRPSDAFARHGLAVTRAKAMAEVAEAWRLYEAGDYEAALAAFSDKLADAAENPAIHAGRGWSLLALGRFVEARQSFAAALKVNPTFALAREGEAALRRPHEIALLKGWNLLAAGHVEAARVQFRRVASLLPERERWRTEEAEAWLLLFEGKVDEAAAILERIVAQRPQAYLSLKGLGYVAIERNDFERAVTLLKRSYRLSPRQIVASFAVPAEKLLKADRPQLALRIAEAGAAVYPADSSLAVVRARIYRALGNTAAALKYAAMAAENDPFALDPHLDEIARHERPFAPVYRKTAWGLYFAGANKRAFERFGDYALAGGDLAQVMRGRGFALYRLGLYEDAAPILAAAVAHEPAPTPINEIVPIPGTDRHWPITYDARATLAWALWKLARYAEAEAEFRDVLRYAPFSYDALTGLAYALVGQNKDEAALAPLRLALVISPGFPDAWQVLRAVQRRLDGAVSVPEEMLP